MKRLKRSLDFILDAFRDYDLLYYSAFFFSPITWIVVLFCIIGYPFLYLWEKGLQNLVFYIFKYHILKIEDKQRLLKIWTTERVGSKGSWLNKYMWKITIKRIEKDLKTN